MDKKKKNKIGGKGMAAAAAGAAALGAGAYYLFGPNKKEHQKKAKVLMGKMRKEIVREAKKAKAVTIPVYHKAVDAISDTYAKEYKLHEKDIRAIAQKLKGEWKGAKTTVKKSVSKLKKGKTKK